MALDPAASLPFYLRGNFGPVQREVTASDLPVEGSLPPELHGLYVRNGPNPRSGDPGHWFLGDGMLHGVRLERGAARWYRNRWVRTRVFEEGAEWRRPDGSADRSVALANTHVIGHAGRILALVETSFPTEVSGELDTLGTRDFGGTLTTGMTAHPKRCPKTGELHFFGYDVLPPFLTYHCLDAAGERVRSEEIAVPAATMMHDFAITDRHVVFMDLPIVFDAERAIEGRFPFAWRDDYEARLGVMPRDGGNSDVRWFEIEPCYVFHPFNAFERGSELVLDVARYPQLWRGGGAGFDPAQLHRFTLDLEAEKVSEQTLDERSIELPRIDERVTGRAHRYGYAVGTTSRGLEEPRELVKYDLSSGATQVHRFGAGRLPGEAVFVPSAAGAAEDEGYVLCYVYDVARNGSDFVVIDATRFDAPPIATVRLPQRVPFGFHGSWIPDPD